MLWSGSFHVNHSPLAQTFCHQYCCCTFSHLNAVPSKLFLAQPVIFTLYASNSPSHLRGGEKGGGREQAAHSLEGPSRRD